MPATVQTLTDIIQLGTNFKRENDIVLYNLQATLNRMHEYIYRPTTVMPDPPEGGWTEANPPPSPTVKYEWHPNMKVMYADNELALVLEYYNTVKDMIEKLQTLNSNAALEAMYNPTPKLNNVLASSLEGVLS